MLIAFAYIVSLVISFSALAVGRHIKMVAVLAGLISCLRGLAITEAGPRFQHTLGIPFPQKLHEILGAEFIDKFEEVLVVGDIHGCFEEMQALLRSVHLGQFANSKILKIFVGDLVNKGPQNKQVIEYMMDNKLDCLSVRGNHDEVVIREYLKFKNDSSSLPAKNEWMKDLTDDEVNYLMSLPYTISIPSLNSVMVHAGLVPGQELNDIDPVHMVTMRNLICEEASSNTAPMTPTKKGSEGEPWASLWPGPQHVYFGHDAKRMLQKYRFATGLDTGCVYGNRLTAIFIKGPRSSQFVHVEAAQIYQRPMG